MKRLFLLTTFLTLLCQISARCEKPSWEYPTVNMPAWHAQAVAIALQEFQKRQGGHTDKGEPVYGDLRHYSVKIIIREEEVEIAFVPDLGPKDRKGVTLGGRTQFGIEVSYHVSAKSRKITKTTFAR